MLAFGIAAVILFCSAKLYRGEDTPVSYDGAVSVMADTDTDTRDAYLARDSVWDYLEEFLTRLLTGET